MPGFLQEVAADLYDRYGDDISSLSVLFPSRRARLFFIDALSGIAERPLWQPRWTTIDELMSEISGLRIGDRVRLVTELYKVYSEFHPESFDKFYFWGEMLLTDFDTIDKYLIDADMLFRNLADIKELEADVSYLSPVQLKIIAFWANFTDETSLSEEKRRFLAVWQTLGPVYRTFRERLRSLGMAYTGMVHRAAAERIKAGGFAFPESRRFVVAGFNALSECEKRLFKFLSTGLRYLLYGQCRPGGRYVPAREPDPVSRPARTFARSFPVAEANRSDFHGIERRAMQVRGFDPAGTGCRTGAAGEGDCRRAHG